VALIALMMEAAQTYETMLNSYQSTQRYNPEDSHRHKASTLQMSKYLMAYKEISRVYDKIIRNQQVQNVEIMVA
jgi:hypothetical protein